jgi:integration host factor beta subunit
MTKSELCTILKHRNSHLVSREVEILVDTVFESMADALVRGERIEIRGFGSWKIKDRSARQARNTKTGEVVEVGAKRFPFFKAGKEILERINKPLAGTGD